MNYGLMPGLNSSQILEIIVNRFLEIMDNAPSTLDVIVFPESTLNSILTAPEIPEVADRVSPCDDATFEEANVAKKISCSAKKHQRYVVINITTKAKCPDIDMVAQNDTRNCADRSDGFSYYNTNVVFDRNGVVVSRYRKYNLFGESVNKPFKPTMVTFDTDFGVTFGHFICFDLMFRRPALELVRTNLVTDIIFTTMWFSELPFLTAVQVQQHWAQSNNVNLIASGANNPMRGSTGSGIYAGNKGALVRVMHGSDETKLYTATVPKINFLGNENFDIRPDIVRYTKEEMKTLYLKRDHLDSYEIRYLVNTDGEHSFNGNFCQNGVCCDYRLNYSIVNSISRPHYHYAMAFYHGNRTFDGFADGGVVACALLTCPTSNASTCGTRDEALLNIHDWSHIEISGTFPRARKFFYLPSTLDTSILPLQPSQFEYKTTDKGSNQVDIVISLHGNVENLLTFGIYGRDFNLDDDEEEIIEEFDDGGVGSTKSITIHLISILFAGFFIRKFL